MYKWIEYEVELKKGMIEKYETLETLEDLMKEHERMGYRLVSYDGKPIDNKSRN